MARLSGGGWVGVLGACVLARVCSGQLPCPIEEVAQMGGSGSVSSNGAVAIYSEADGFNVLDVSDPASAKEVARVRGLGSPFGIRHRLAGEHALVAAGDRLRIFDLSDPAEPVEVSSLVARPGESSTDRPAVDGGVAYLIYPGSPAVVVSIDISEPGAPTILDDVPATDGRFAWISAGGGVVACGTRQEYFGPESAFCLIDADDPSAMERVWTQSSSLAGEVACSGGITCLTSYRDLSIYDTSDPRRPILLSQIQSAEVYHEVEFVGDRLFTGFSTKAGAGFLVYDLASPSSPVSLGPFVPGTGVLTPHNDGALLVHDSAIWHASVEPGGVVVELVHPTVGGIGSGVFFGDRLAVGSTSGMHVYDVRDSRAPHRTFEFIEMPLRPGRVVGDGDLAYFARDDELAIFDLSDPGSPKLLSDTPLNEMAFLSVDGPLVVSTLPVSGTLHIYDVSNPSAPFQAGTITLSQFLRARDTAIEGAVALVAIDAVSVVDLTEPSSPTVLAEISDRADTVELHDRFAYVGGYGSPPLHIYDLRAPSQPVLVGEVSDLGGTVRGLYARGNRLYVSVDGGSNGFVALMVFDITDRADPVRLATFDLLGGEHPDDAAANGHGLIALPRFGGYAALLQTCPPCYADCDASGHLDIFDFLCFQDAFVQGVSRACDCDTSTGAGVCDVLDFLCFEDVFAAGCP